MASTHRSWLPLVALASLLALTLVACDSGGGNGGGGDGNESFPEPPGRPGFTSTVTGAWQASLSGTAVHATEGGASSVRILLEDAGSDRPIITMATDGPLRPGGYAIQPVDSGITARIEGPADEHPWTGVSGKLQVDRVDGAAITGRFRIVASGPRGEFVTASGTFTTAASR